MSSNPEIETIQITSTNLDKLKFNSEGLIPAIAQDYKTGDVLMMAWMNIDSLKDTLKNKKASYWSRSRKTYWVKGETSGHFQHVKEVFYDCDCDRRQRGCRSNGESMNEVRACNGKQK